MNSLTAKSRLFIAMPLSQQIRDALKLHMEELKKTYAFQKWVHPDDLHITLKFLGDTSQTDAEKVQSELERIACRHKPFGLTLQGTGTFGKPASPSILWIGIQGDLPLLASVQSDAEEAMEPHGFAKENRAFRPHLTIARRYNGEGPFSATMLQQAPAPLHWTADRIVLYKSHLNRQPMYEAWKTFMLDASPPGQA